MKNKVRGISLAYIPDFKVDWIYYMEKMNNQLMDMLVTINVEQRLDHPFLLILDKQKSQIL